MPVSSLKMRTDKTDVEYLYRQGFLRVKSDIDLIQFYFNRKGPDPVMVFPVQTTPVYQGKCLFMKRTGNFGLVTLCSGHSAAQRHLLFVRTKILGCKPFAAPAEMKKSDPMLIGGTATAG